VPNGTKNTVINRLCDHWSAF